MTELNVPSYCADLAEFTDAFVERVDEEEGLLVLYGSQELPVGERVAFQVFLDDGTVALGGAANVLEVADGGEERDEESRYDFFLDQLELDAASEVMMERLFMQRASFGEEGVDTTGQVNLDELEVLANESEETAAEEVAVDLEDSGAESFGAEDYPAAEAGEESTAAEFAEVAGDEVMTDAGDLGDFAEVAGDEVMTDATMGAEDMDGFSAPEPEEAAMPPALNQADGFGGEPDLEGYDPSGEHAGPEDVLEAHTVVEEGLSSSEDEVPSFEATGEVELGDLEEFEGLSDDVELAPAEAVGADFFSPAAGGVGLFRPTLVAEWQAAQVDLTTVPAGERFAASAGLGAPGEAPRPVLDAAMRVVGLGAGFKPTLVRLTEAGESAEFGATMPDAGDEAAEVSAPSDVDVDMGFEPAEDDGFSVDVGDADLDMGSLAEDAASETEEVELPGVDVDLGEGGDTLAVDLPPFDEGEDDGIDVEL